MGLANKSADPGRGGQFGRKSAVRLDQHKEYEGGSVPLVTTCDFVTGKFCARVM